MLPFETYNEAVKYFGIKIPKPFFHFLSTVDAYCREAGTDTPDTLFDVFGLLRIEGNEARYQQTPIELFPFASTGGDGIHYGFVIHTMDEDDYPSGEICPMDDDGVVIIGIDTHSLFQNLLCDEESIRNHLPLLKELGLDPTIIDRGRYDKSGMPLRIRYPSKPGWKFVDTSDGAGVFAPEKYFDSSHTTKYDHLNRDKAIAQYEQLAFDMSTEGLYASQLFYLKELYWKEWTNYELAKNCLEEMLKAYEKLDREHLCNTTKWTIDTFDKRFIH